MGKRRKSRELAMQMLFQSDLGRQTAEQVQKTFWPARASANMGRLALLSNSPEFPHLPSRVAQPA